MRREESTERAETRGRLKKGLAALGAIILAAALFAYGASASQAQEEPTLPEAERPAELIADTSYDEFFYGTGNWEFMSDETMARFQREFYEWLAGDGRVEDGAYVYLHAEEIACDDGVWSAYARTPFNDIYYRVTFDPLSKEITYRAVEAPLFAAAEPESREVFEATRDEPVAMQDETAREDARNASENIPVDDTGALAAIMPQQAADSLARIVSEYAASKGIETSTALCSVYPASVTTSATVTTMDILAYDSQKNGYLIQADYDSATNLFGMTLSPL